MMMTVGQPKGYFKKIALVSGLVVSSISVSSVFAPANATIFTVPDYGTYDIETLYTSFSNDPTTLSSQPWFGNITEAIAFATTVGPFFGEINVPPVAPAGDEYSVYFLYDSPQDVATYSYLSNSVTTAGGVVDVSVNNGIRYFAVASAVPEPFNILGATTSIALFGAVSTALKKRKVSK